LTRRANQNVPTMLYGGKKLAQLCFSNNKIYGLLARGVPATINTASLDIGNLKGKYGENVIGSMLNILALENDELYVFHSISAPNNKPGETDHVILYKNKLILIETKTYSNFKAFKINKEGDLRGRKVGENNTLRMLENNNLIEKVKDYEMLFPEYSVHAITAITRSNVQTTSENGKYKVASLANILQNIEYHMEKALDVDDELNKESIHYLASHCLSK
jgi:hypothetical protein